MLKHPSKVVNSIINRMRDAVEVHQPYSQIVERTRLRRALALQEIADARRDADRFDGRPTWK
jgi:hypothetical protein